MSGICGSVGDADDKDTLARMLDAIDYRGDTSVHEDRAARASAIGGGAGRPGKSPGISARWRARCRVRRYVRAAGRRRLPLDRSTRRARAGCGSPTRMARSPSRSTTRRRASSCSSAIRSACARSTTSSTRGVVLLRQRAEAAARDPALPVELDPAAIHKYLTFSFVPGEDVPIAGIQRAAAGPRRCAARRARSTTQPYFTLRETIDPELARRHGRGAPRPRSSAARPSPAGSTASPRSGCSSRAGIDSSGVARLAASRPASTCRRFSLDFGERSVEREQATAGRASSSASRSTLRAGRRGASSSRCSGISSGSSICRSATRSPGRSTCSGRARGRPGSRAVFNGEGGDQLFGGWTSKPMIAAAAVRRPLRRGREPRGDVPRARTTASTASRTSSTRRASAPSVGGPGPAPRAARAVPRRRRDAATFLNRVRLADISLKGSQNILPRAERMANALGLDVRVPLFDRALAEASFRCRPS